MRMLLLSTCALAAALLAAADAAALELDEALKEKAPKVLELARKREAKNVGVLKFLVRKGDGPLSDNAGPLNLNLANRLAVALVLACPDEEVGIIGNANEVLAKVP